jgi:hypothetical protein
LCGIFRLCGLIGFSMISSADCFVGATKSGIE